MWELFIHPSNIVFSVSLLLMLVLSIFEICLTLVGGGSQDLLQQFLPQELNHQIDIDIQHEYGVFVKTLDWLYLGKVPLLVWLIIFLSTFSLLGFFIQSLIFQFTQTLLSAWIIAPLCLFLCMPFVRLNTQLLMKILPQDETTAIHSNELIGLSGVIILGEARRNYPAQAKVRDIYGLTHYVLVEPENDDCFTEGQTVLLTNKTHNGYKAQLSSD